MGLSPNGARRSGGKLIFVVNDDPDILELIHVLLELKGYDVATSNNTPETWEKIAELQPSLVTIDLNPLNPSGRDLLERMHAEAVTTDIPTIVTSTNPYLLEQVRAEPKRYGGEVYMGKPYDVAGFLDAIHELIGPV